MPPITNAATPAPARAEPQRSERRRLLLAAVVLGDEGDERGNDHRRRRAAQGLGRDHDACIGADGHQRLRDAEGDDRGAKDPKGAKPLTVLAPSMTKPATIIE